jgi:hypothetical protein
MYSPAEAATWYSSLLTREPPIFKPIGSSPRAGGKVGEFVFELVRSGLGHWQPWHNLGTCQPRRTTHFILFMCVVCVSCAADTYSPTEGASNISTCESCPESSSAPSGSSPLTSCQCHVGYYGPHGGPCTICPGNTYATAIGSAECSACPDNAESPIGSSVLAACLCIAGYYGAHGGSCAGCSANTYATELGSASCSECTAHSFSPNRSRAVGSCDCEPGFYGPHEGPCAVSREHVQARHRRRGRGILPDVPSARQHEAAPRPDALLVRHRVRRDGLCQRRAGVRGVSRRHVQHRRGSGRRVSADVCRLRNVRPQHLRRAGGQRVHGGTRPPLSSVPGTQRARGEAHATRSVSVRRRVRVGGRVVRRVRGRQIPEHQR